jgi:hypothetical protein
MIASTFLEGYLVRTRHLRNLIERALILVQEGLVVRTTRADG